MASRFSNLCRVSMTALTLLLAGCIDADTLWARGESPEAQRVVDSYRRLREVNEEHQAQAVLQSATDPVLLASLSAVDALLVNRLAADVADSLDDQPRLMAALGRASASPLAEQRDFTRQLQSQIANFDMAGADDTMRILRTRWPRSALRGLTPNQVMDFERGLSDLSERPGAQLDFERYLDAIGWHRPRDWFTSDGAVLRQAVQEWELGDQAKAELLLKRLTLPVAIAAVRADRRFDGIVEANPEVFDLSRATKREISRLRRAVWLECCKRRWGAPSAALTLSQALYVAGDDAGALVAAEQAWGRDQNKSGFENAAIAMARLALRRGAITKAEASLRDVFSGYPTPDVGQAVAELLVATDRGETALQVLAPITNGDLGRLKMDQRIKFLALEVCAAAQTGDQLKIAPALGYIDLHAAAGLDDMIDAHLCIGDIQGAAVLMGRMLEDPRRRHSALLELQTWKPPAYSTRWDLQMAARRRLLVARPEVASVLRRVGRINIHDMRYTAGVQ